MSIILDGPQEDLDVGGAEKGGAAAILMKDLSGTWEKIVSSSKIVCSRSLHKIIYLFPN